MMARVQKLKTQTLLVVSLWAATLTHAQKSHQLVKPEDQEISVNGTIRLVHGFGPPGYGETPKEDVPLSYWALETPIPINTPCTPEKPEFASECSAANRMKLFFQGLELETLNQLPAAKWRNKHVVVHGKIHRADTAGEMTVIYMDVSKIESATPQPHAKG